MQHLELLAGQAEMRAQELAAAQAAAAAGGAESDAEEGEEQEAVAAAEVQAAAEEEEAAAGAKAVDGAAPGEEGEEDAADTTHASPASQSPHPQPWRGALPSALHLPPLRLSPRQPQPSAERRTTGGVNRRQGHGGRRYAPY